jgi:hypothetical protein
MNLVSSISFARVTVRPVISAQKEVLIPSNMSVVNKDAEMLFIALLERVFRRKFLLDISPLVEIRRQGNIK